MPQLDAGTVTVTTNELLPTQRLSWWHKSYPFRASILIYVYKNPLTAGETVEASLPGNLISLGKARSDLADIQVLRLHDGVWQKAPTECVLEDDVIKINFQIIDDIALNEYYYVYYGNIELENLEAVASFAGGEFHNEVDFSSKYVSYTNPTEDWIANPTGYVTGSRPGSKIFSELYVERFRVIGRKGPDMGTLLVYVDNVLQSEVDLYSVSSLTDQELATYETPGLGETKIVLVIGDKKNFASSDFNVIIDSIQYDTKVNVDMGEEIIYPKLSWSSSSGVS